MAGLPHSWDDFAREQREVVFGVWRADAKDDVVHALFREAKQLVSDIIWRADKGALA